MNNQKQQPNQEPLISVIMSTYNRADNFLSRAIDSVLTQSFKDFELIIVNDCSTDDTDEVLAKYQEQDSRIRLFKTKENSGSDTLPKNRGIMESRGKYIAYIDDDVEFLSFHLEILLNEFKQNEDLDIVYCESLLYKDGKQYGKAICQCKIPGGDGTFNGQFLLNRNYIDTSQVMHKRELIFNVGGWDEKLPKFVDWNLWVRMLKWGAKFQHAPIAATNYHVHEATKSARVETKSWVDPELGITMFEPTFNTAGCYIYLPYLGNDNPAEKTPLVAIFTITYDRLDYTKRMWASLQKSTKYPFMWTVFDNGSKDGTQDWITKQTEYTGGAASNKGLSYASNYLIDKIFETMTPQIIIKVDNDCDFKTVGWLETLVDLWKRNHKFYMSPYVEGLIDNPGGGPRVGSSFVGPHYVEVTQHIGGILAAIDARAYSKFRWNDRFLHGNQDREASDNFRKQGFMPLYYPQHRVMHMDSTIGQKAKYPDYFERRIEEKTTQVDSL